MIQEYDYLDVNCLNPGVMPWVYLHVIFRGADVGHDSGLPIRTVLPLGRLSAAHTRINIPVYWVRLSYQDVFQLLLEFFL